MFSPSFNFCGESSQLLSSTFENMDSKDCDLKSSFIVSGSESGIRFLITVSTSFAVASPDVIFMIRALLTGSFDNVLNSCVFVKECA